MCKKEEGKAGEGLTYRKALVYSFVLLRPPPNLKKVSPTVGEPRTMERVTKIHFSSTERKSQRN
jgi:hypothetical protein